MACKRPLPPPAALATITRTGLVALLSLADEVIE
jgi:hypothetical protein